MTSRDRVRHNPGVPLRRRLSAALLLLAAGALPQLLWLAAHALAHHGHAESTERAALANALIHGHEHEEGVPDHEHNLLPSPPLRRDTPPDLQVPPLASLQAPDAGRLLLSGPRAWWSPARIAGPGPVLHLLCILLI